MTSENTPQNTPEPTPDSTPVSSAQGFSKLNIPPAIAKILGGVLLVVLLLGLVSGSDCWFSINSTCPGPIVPPELLLGGIVAVALVTFLGVPVAPAAMAGAGVWVVLQWFLPFAGN